MPAAARVGDMAKQDAPHCHTPHGPAGPIPHPTLPLTITGPGAATVMIGKKPAAILGIRPRPARSPAVRRVGRV